MAKRYTVMLTEAELAAVITALTFVDAGGGIDGELAREAQARGRVVRKLKQTSVVPGSQR